MTYRDPDDPRTFTNPEVRYRDSADPMRRTYDDPARPRAWNTGSAVGALIVLALIVVAAIAYAMNSGSMQTASGPGTSHPAPSTTGQGGPGAAPTGAAR
jgi:hypothetical protein